MTVSFFGHRDSFNIPLNKLKLIISNLITNEGADMFYVGNNGNFDAAVLSCLALAKKLYPHIDYAIVLAYMPKVGAAKDRMLTHPTILPRIVAEAHPKYAIITRNNWMIDNSDTVVSYVIRNYGGAAKFKHIALKKKKRVIELSDLQHQDIL